MGRRPRSMGPARASQGGEAGLILMLLALLAAALLLGRWSDAATASPASAPTAGPATGARVAHPTAASLQRSHPTALEREPFVQTIALQQQAPRQLRVGLQVGHWRMDERPSELGGLKPSAAAHGDLEEHELNLMVAREAARLLRREGYAVDLLGVTIPPGYQADAFVAIHADAAETQAARGWKIAAPWRASRASAALRHALVRDYAATTGLPESAGPTTDDMLGYYAFNYHRFQHAIAPSTPAVIVELGFMSSPEDREVLLEHPDLAGQGIARGVKRFLDRHPARGAWAYKPLALPEQRTVAARTPLYAAPGDDAPILEHLGPGKELVAYDLAAGWYLVTVRGEWQILGWVRVGDLDGKASSTAKSGAFWRG